MFQKGSFVKHIRLAIRNRVCLFAMSFVKCWNKRMDRRELIRRMVLDAISDDFENVDQIILPNVSEDCRKIGFVVERSEIVRALAGLVEDGLAAFRRALRRQDDLIVSRLSLRAEKNSGEALT